MIQALYFYTEPKILKKFEVTSLTLQSVLIFPALVYSNTSADEFIQATLGLFHAAEKEKYFILCSWVISLRSGILT